VRDGGISAGGLPSKYAWISLSKFFIGAGNDSVSEICFCMIALRCLFTESMPLRDIPFFLQHFHAALFYKNYFPVNVLRVSFKYTNILPYQADQRGKKNTFNILIANLCWFTNVYGYYSR
jgi:hypothetical protein